MARKSKHQRAVESVEEYVKGEMKQAYKDLDAAIKANNEQARKFANQKVDCYRAMKMVFDWIKFEVENS